MDWLKTLLKNAGFEEAKIDEFVTEFNKEVPKHLIPKEKYNELAETKKKLEGDLGERDKQLEELKKSSGNNKELQDQIAKLQEENKAAKEQYEQQANELKLNAALKLALAGKVHKNALDNVIAEFDKSKIVLDDLGNIKEGFDDQEKSLRESKGFYFVPEKKDEGIQFKGFKPFEGSSGGSEGDKNNNFGKQLAEANKQSNEAMQKAQANYFGNGGN